MQSSDGSGAPLSLVRGDRGWRWGGEVEDKSHLGTHLDKWELAFPDASFINVPSIQYRRGAFTVVL